MEGQQIPLGPVNAECTRFLHRSHMAPASLLPPQPCKRRLSVLKTKSPDSSSVTPGQLLGPLPLTPNTVSCAPSSDLSTVGRSPAVHSRKQCPLSGALPHLHSPPAAWSDRQNLSGVLEKGTGVPRSQPRQEKGIWEPPPQPFRRKPQAHRSGSGELLQIILNLVGVTAGCDIDKFQKPLFEGQVAEELLGPTAVGAGGLDEHNYLPRLDFAVHKCLSHAHRLLSPGEETSIAGIAGEKSGALASWLLFKGTSLEEEFAR